MDNQKKKKFELRTGLNPDNSISNNIYVDGNLFDWSINEKDYKQIMDSKDPVLIRAMQMDITRHFIESLSEFVGKKVTIADIEEAKKTGWI